MTAARKIDPLHLMHRVYFVPRYQSDPYRQHSGRRFQIHGPLVGLDYDNRVPGWAWLVALAVAAPFIASLIGVAS